MSKLKAIFAGFALSGFRLNEKPIFGIEQSSSGKDLPIEVVMEKVKLVALNNYDFEYRGL